jgi:hypothetical protein
VASSECALRMCEEPANSALAGGTCLAEIKRILAHQIPGFIIGGIRSEPGSGQGIRCVSKRTAQIDGAIFLLVYGVDRQAEERATHIGVAVGPARIRLR